VEDKKWARLLAYVTGLVNQRLLLQNEYLAAENRILRSHLPADCGSPIRRDPLWLKLASGSVAGSWSSWRVSPGQTPFWPATVG
jgi:hypothetical protein